MERKKVIKMARNINKKRKKRREGRKEERKKIHLNGSSTRLSEP
jgi:hypothetical protein